MDAGEWVGGRAPPRAASNAGPRTSLSPRCSSSSKYSRPFSERTAPPPPTRISDTRFHRMSANTMPTTAEKGMNRVATQSGKAVCSAGAAMVTATVTATK